MQPKATISRFLETAKEVSRQAEGTTEDQFIALVVQALEKAYLAGKNSRDTKRDNIVDAQVG